MVDAFGAGATILSVVPMGRSSTEMHAVDVRDGSGQGRHLALRRYVESDRLLNDPWYRPANEAEALRILADGRVPAPRLIAVDPEARDTDVPALLETRVPGRTIHEFPVDMDRYLAEAVDLLLSIHDVDPSRAARLPSYAPYRPPLTLVIPPWSNRPDLWVDVLRVLNGPAPDAESRFIHRDYHPGNILVGPEGITGVVDWLTACRGPRSIDVARMRLNLAADFGLDAADRFLVLYREKAGPDWEHDPYWDLLDAVDMAQDWARPRTRRQAEAWDRFERWVGSAPAALGDHRSP